MAYIVHQKKPYFVSGKGIFPCSISATSITIDFNNPVKRKIERKGCIYTEAEIRKLFGIKLVDKWDEESQKVIRASNRTISSIPKNSDKPIENKLEKGASK